MTTITIKIKDKENVSFFLKLLQKFNFITDVSLSEEKHSNQLTKEMTVDWAEKRPDIGDFSGIWSDRNITLKELREKAWKRN